MIALKSLYLINLDQPGGILMIAIADILSKAAFYASLMESLEYTIIGFLYSLIRIVMIAISINANLKI